MGDGSCSEHKQINAWTREWTGTRRTNIKTWRNGHKSIFSVWNNFSEAGHDYIKVHTLHRRCKRDKLPCCCRHWTVSTWQTAALIKKPTVTWTHTTSGGGCTFRRTSRSSCSKYLSVTIEDEGRILSTCGINITKNIWAVRSLINYEFSPWYRKAQNQIESSVFM